MAGHPHHDNDDHDHGHEGHDHAPATPVIAEASWSQKFKRIGSDFKQRMQGTNPHADGHDHGHGHDAIDHVHNNKIGTVGKVGIVVGSAVSLGVAIQGVATMARGMTGWEDQYNGEKHNASLATLVVGAGEVAGGLALAKRIGTGTFKFVG